MKIHFNRNYTIPRRSYSGEIPSGPSMHVWTNFTIAVM